MNSGKPAPRTRPGGRSATVNRSVLEAALAEVVDRGYGDFTFESVATRAGVHRSTIYRHWSNKEDLVADALLAFSAVAIPMPDTGSTDDDLDHLATSIARNIGSPFGEGLLRALISDASRVPAVVSAAQRFWEQRFALVRDVTGRAVARGDLPADLDADAFVEALVSPLFFRLFVTGKPIDEDDARAAVRRTVEAAQHGLLSRPKHERPRASSHDARGREA